MGTHEFLYQLDEEKIAVGLLAALLLATEAGFWRGRAVGESLAEATKSELSTLQGAMIGLLALLLGFSFVLAESRFDLRRELVVEESNAIGTTYLRSRMLTEPLKSDIGKLLQKYVDARLEYFDAGIRPEKLDDALARTEGLQKELWSQAIAAVEKNPSPVPTGLFVSSLNDTIDLHSKRDAARLNHVPESVLWLLFFVATATMALVGYGCGVGNRRNLTHTVVVALILSTVIVVIMDLDRPRRGLIQVSQAAMINLRDSFQR